MGDRWRAEAWVGDRWRRSPVLGGPDSTKRGRWTGEGWRRLGERWRLAGDLLEGAWWRRCRRSGVLEEVEEGEWRRERCLEWRLEAVEQEGERDLECE